MPLKMEQCPVLNQKITHYGLHKKLCQNYFGKHIKTISKHLTNIFESEELVKSEVILNPNDFNNTEIVIINPNAKTQPILYNMDTIISVGYRDHQTGNKRAQRAYCKNFCTG